jgi:hypothetical protein
VLFKEWAAAAANCCMGVMCCDCASYDDHFINAPSGALCKFVLGASM